MNKGEDFEIEIDGIDNDYDEDSQRTMSLAADSDMASSSRESELDTEPSSGVSPLHDENEVILTDHENDTNMGSYQKNQFHENRMKYMSFRYGWCHRTIFTDWTVSWLNGFIAYMQDKPEVKAEYLLIISDEEKAKNLYQKWCVNLKNKGQLLKQTVWKLTFQGMFKYGFLLCIVECCTIIAIYMIRLIIDYLHDQKEPFFHYHFVLFLTFNCSRSVAILVRNYYDLHVYNFFRYVQTAIQAWIFEDILELNLWVKIGQKENYDEIKDSEA
jgi:hypothetical protein